jgi:tRNA(fMet)-specific endonuclease VapC
MYLFDTDILSNLLKRAPAPALLARVAATAAVEQATTSVTLGELLYGAIRLGPQGVQLLDRIEQVLLRNLTILPFDERAARQYAPLRAVLERNGTPLADADLRIAAIALAHQKILVTANERHFRRVPGLTLENWLI